MENQHDQLRTLLDRTEITELIDRFFRSLDERGLDLDWGRSTFTGNIRVTFPAGEHQGLESVVEAIRRAMRQFGPTQHSGSNYLIDLDGDRAAVRWNAIQTHLRPGATPFDEPFVSGGYYDGEVVRTAGGWRLGHLTYHLVWLSGQPPHPPTV
jgi:hypothetical protein